MTSCTPGGRSLEPLSYWENCGERGHIYWILSDATCILPPFFLYSKYLLVLKIRVRGTFSHPISILRSPVLRGTKFTKFCASWGLTALKNHVSFTIFVCKIHTFVCQWGTLLFDSTSSNTVEYDFDE